MTDELNEKLRRLLDGDLDSLEVQRVLHEAADEEEARDLLRFEFAMRDAFEPDRDVASTVPDGFSDRVMHQVLISERRANAAPSSPGRAVRRSLSTVIRALFAKRPIMLRPAYGLVAALMLALGASWAVQQQSVSPSGGLMTTERVDDDLPGAADSGDVLVRFVYLDSEASTVAVAGDFTEWEPTELHRQNVDGRVVWSGLIPVPRGEHRYMYVVDGDEWTSDPLATVSREDGFGNTNAILTL